MDDLILMIMVIPIRLPSAWPRRHPPCHAPRILSLTRKPWRAEAPHVSKSSGFWTYGYVHVTCINTFICIYIIHIRTSGIHCIVNTVTCLSFHICITCLYVTQIAILNPRIDGHLRFAHFKEELLCSLRPISWRQMARQNFLYRYV